MHYKYVPIVNQCLDEGPAVSIFDWQSNKGTNCTHQEGQQHAQYYKSFENNKDIKIPKYT